MDNPYGFLFEDLNIQQLHFNSQEELQKFCDKYNLKVSNRIWKEWREKRTKYVETRILSEGKTMNKLSEEEFKFLWRSNHPELDLEYIGKYDAKSKCGGLTIEFKRDCKDWKKMITQALLTAARDNKKYKIVGGVSTHYPEGVFIDAFEFSMPSIKKFNATPSKWESREWQLAHNDLSPRYESLIRKCPTREELDTILNAYQIQNSFTKEQKEGFSQGFKFFGLAKQFHETKWAVPEEIDKLNAYYTPEPLRIKVKEIVTKNWPNLKTIWDPYGGDGALVNQFDCEVIISDIRPQGSGIIEMDFLKDNIPNAIENKFGPDFAIVTNPSFGKKHIHNLINFCRNNKIKLATFGYCGDFPYEPLPAIDSFISVRWPDWKGILPQFGYRKNEIIPFILFNPEHIPIDAINGFEFLNKDALYQHRTCSRVVGCKLPTPYFNRASHIPPEKGGKLLTRDIYEWVLQNVSEQKHSGQKISWTKKKTLSEQKDVCSSGT